MVIPKGAIRKVCYILHRGQQFQTHLYQFVFHLLATKMHICTTYLQGREPKVETQPGANLCTTSLIPSHIAKPVSWVIFVWNWIWCIGQFLAQGWKEKEMRITKWERSRAICALMLLFDRQILTLIFMATIYITCSIIICTFKDRSLEYITSFSWRLP